MGTITSINNITVQEPSSLKYGEIYIHDEDSGRFASGLAYIGIIAEKRTLSLEWRSIRPAAAQTILGAVRSDQFFDVTYFEPDANSYVTRTFYLGDRTVQFLQWFSGGEAYASLTFDLIER